MASSGTSSVVMFVFLFIYPWLAAAESTASTTSVEERHPCIPCYHHVCSEQTPCLQECVQICPENYYQSGLVCEAPPDTTTSSSVSSSTTTITTATTEVVTSVNGTSHNVSHLAVAQSAGVHNGSAVSRRRRQTMNATEEPETAITVETTTTTWTTVPTTTTIATTTAPKRVCRLCSIEACNSCGDGSDNSTICSSCQEGYHLSSDFKSCLTSEDELPAGAIAGIVIGTVCFLAIVVVAIVCVVRRCSGSRDVNNQNQQPGRPRVGRESIISPPLPKIGTEDMQRQHDRVTRYARDPTYKKKQTPTRGEPSEEYEIKKLGIPPVPPVDDTSNRYDRPQTRNFDDPQSYSSLEEEKGQTYANVGNAVQNHKQGEYANTQQAGASPRSPPKVPQILRKPTDEVASPASVEIYEPIDTSRVDEEHEELQEEYVNTDFIIKAQSDNAGLEEGQEIYANDTQNITEEVYENT